MSLAAQAVRPLCPAPSGSGTRPSPRRTSHAPPQRSPPAICPGSSCSPGRGVAGFRTRRYPRSSPILRARNLRSASFCDSPRARS
jgi:hypothetical protein